MPIYEYVCPDCESRFELLRPLSQAAEGAACPGCHQSAERVLSVFACFSTNESGLAATVGGSSCSSCGATSCDTCAA
ncbi:MAG: zinc ribbon domain-containing protein [Chloroflexi bacterium]|nr:zinc ribbon domain-containing protein [Chloroflexota bacterium]MBI3931130.1 zinc ribbon domain-containing protein [Chloroflexota bacterium]